MRFHRTRIGRTVSPWNQLGFQGAPQVRAALRVRIGRAPREHQAKTILLRLVLEIFKINKKNGSHAKIARKNAKFLTHFQTLGNHQAGQMLSAPVHCSNLVKL